jgi:hypothetical protein
MRELICFLGLAIASSAQAQDEKWFVTGSVGQLRTGFDNVSPNVTVDRTASTWSLGGGLMLNNTFGVEAGYRDFGALNIRGSTWTNKLKGTAWTLGGVANFPVSEKFTAVARVGRFNWTSTVETTNTSTSGYNNYFGAGLSYALTNNTSLVTNFTRFNSSSANMNDSDVIEFGLKMSF